MYQRISHCVLVARPLLLGAIICLTIAFTPLVESCHGSAFSDQGNTQSASIGLSTPSDGQGVYEGCDPGTSACLAHLKTIAASGFKLVMNYESVVGSASDLLAYARQAHAVGIKLIWSLSAPHFYNGSDLRRSYPELAAACACANNAGFLRYLVGLLKQQPATWGYYTGDEVDEHLLPQFTAYTRLLKQLDPRHPQLLIQGANTPNDAAASLPPFARRADVIGVDFYPIGSTANMRLEDTGKVAQAMQSVADRYGEGGAMALQAFSWTEYPNENWRCGGLATCPFPSRSDMQQQLTMVLRYARPRLILWYSYFDVLKSEQPEQNWEDLVTVTSTVS